MRNLFFIILFHFLGIIGLFSQTVTGRQGESFVKREIATGLADPWEITYGPDDFIWVTESKAYLVSRIDPETGEKTILLDLNEERKFPRYDTIPEEKDGGKKWPQGGLMGMSLHPDFENKPFIYLCYVYDFTGKNDEGSGCAENFGRCLYKGRLVRYEYDEDEQKLSNPQILKDNIPQSDDHNSGRLTIGMVRNEPYLFYSVGDMGAGQYDNAGQTNMAQNVEKYEGKILRFRLEPDTDENDPDKWVPDDNPFNDGEQSAVWTYGHRNPQGLVFTMIDGIGYLYSSEHGPFGDDEINIIEKGRNYGHPLVIGYNDNNYNGYAAAVTEYESLPGPWNTSLPIITSENSNAAKIGAEYRDPIKAFYTIHPDSLKVIFERTVNEHTEEPDWPAVAPSSIDVYTSSVIPQWQNSLLVPSLTEGKLIRLKLNSKGDGVIGDQLDYFEDDVRYRDLTISPDGSKIYLSTDKSPESSEPSSEEDQEEMSCQGCIIEFTYINNESDQ